MSLRESIRISRADALEIQGMSRREAFQNMVLCLIGAMICLLPKYMDRSGYLMAPPLLLLSALVTIRMGTLICEACSMVEQAEGSRAGSVKSYEELARAVGMFEVLAVTKNTVMLACIMMSMNVQVDALAGLWPKGLWNLFAEEAPKDLFRWGVLMPLYVGSALLRDLTQVNQILWVGVLGMVVEVFGILGGILLNFGEGGKTYSALPPEGDLLAVAGGTFSGFVFTFAILATVPSVRAQMQHPEEMCGALRDAILFTAVLYEGVMVLGYFSFGQGMSENVVPQISKDFPKFGVMPSLGLFVNIMITVPIFFFCVISVVEHTGTDAVRTPGTLVNTAARVSMVVVLTGISWALPGLLPMIGVFSSVFCVCNNLWFPLSFYHKLCRQVGRPVPARVIFLNTALGILGVFVLVYGLTDAIEGLRNEM